MKEKKIIFVDEEILDLVPGYLENRRNELATLDQAAARADFKELRSIGHKLKGVAASYGMPELGRIGQRLESDAEKADLAACRERIAEIRGYLEAVEVRGGAAA